jgi:hypothetical protein
MVKYSICMVQLQVAGHKVKWVMCCSLKAKFVWDMDAGAGSGFLCCSIKF